MTAAAPRRTAAHLPWLMISEALGGLVGFAVTLHFARSLGATAFGHVELASVVVGWLLVAVRSGVEQVVHREAARRPRLIGPLTDLLLGIKGVGAVLGLALLAAGAVGLGPERGSVLVLGGSLLVPSALVVDVGPRAIGRLGIVAVCQGSRSLALAALGFGLVHQPGDAAVAATCLALAELIGSLPYLRWHWTWYGPPRPRWRHRACLALLQRGLLASLIRFLRVGLYAADVLVLGLVLVPEWETYAAARRVVFALVAIGLVVPAAYGPLLGRAWAEGVESASAVLGNAAGLVAALALPAAVGLAILAGPLMDVLFGPRFPNGGGWLALTAARLPFLLTASLAQVALVACRRETTALRISAGMAAAAFALLPPAAWWRGLNGVGWAMIAIELAGAVLGGLALARLGLKPVLPGFRGTETFEKPAPLAKYALSPWERASSVPAFFVGTEK